MTTKRRFVMIEGLESRVLFDASQLTETILSSTLPASVSDQSTLHGAVSLQVSNNSGVIQKFKGKVGIYFADGALNFPGGSFTILRSMPASISLQNGQSKTYKIPISIARGNLPDATDTLFGVVTDQSSLFSQSPAGPTLQVRPPINLLSETETLLRLPASTMVGATLKAVDKVTITNGGSDPFSGLLNIALLAAPNDTVAGAIAVSSLQKKLTIPAGHHVTVALNFKSEAALSPGTFQMISAVTQPNGTVTSSNPATAPSFTIQTPITTPIFVDSIDSVSEMYATTTSGKHITQLDLQMSIQNNGTNSIGTDMFTLYASTKPTLDSSATDETTLPLTLDIYSLQNFGFQIAFGIPDNGPDNGTVVNDYIFVKVTDTSGGVSLASYPTPILFAGPNG